MNLKRFSISILVLILFAVIGYSGHQLWDIHSSQAQESDLHNRLMQYHPLSQSSTSIESFADDTSTLQTDDVSALQTNNASSSQVIVNPSIVALQTNHSDVVGWLTVPNTEIDYPFVQGADNNYYLHLDLDQRQSAAGTLFMDFRNNKDFSDFNTIIYGHHMRSGSMFGTLRLFDNPNFFDSNRSATIFLANQTYEIEIMAFAVIKPNDAIIYNPIISTDTEKLAFINHVESVARYSRDIGITTDDRIVTLSTCNYEFENARMVLIGILVEP